MAAGIRHQVPVFVIDYFDRHKMFCLVVGDAVDGAFNFLHDILVCSRCRERNLTEGIGIVGCILGDRYACLRRHRGVTDILDREGKAVRSIPCAADQVFSDPDFAFAGSGIGICNGGCLYQLAAGIRHEVPVTVIFDLDRYMMFCLIIGDTVDAAFRFLHDILVCSDCRKFDRSKGFGIFRCILRNRYAGLRRHRGVTDILNREGKAVRGIPCAAGQIFPDFDFTFTGSGIGIRNVDSLYQLAAGIRHQVPAAVIFDYDRYKMYRFIIGDTTDIALCLKDFVLIRSGRSELDGSEGVGIFRCILRDRYACLRRHWGVTDLFQCESIAVHRIPGTAYQILLYFDLAAACCGIGICGCHCLHQLAAGICHQIPVSVIFDHDRHMMFRFIISDPAYTFLRLFNDVLVRSGCRKGDRSEGVGISRCILLDGYACFRWHRGFADLTDREGVAVHCIPGTAFKVFLYFDLTAACRGIGVGKRSCLHQLASGICHEVPVTVIDYHDRYKMFRFIIGDAADAALSLNDFVSIRSGCCKPDGSEGVGIFRRILRDGYA